MKNKTTWDTWASQPSVCKLCVMLTTQLPPPKRTVIRTNYTLHIEESIAAAPPQPWPVPVPAPAPHPKDLPPPPSSGSQQQTEGDLLWHWDMDPCGRLHCNAKRATREGEEWWARGRGRAECALQGLKRQPSTLAKIVQWYLIHNFLLKWKPIFCLLVALSLL